VGAGYPVLREAIAGIPLAFIPYLELAAAYAWAGHDKAAKETVAQLQKVQPGYTVQAWASRHMSDNPTYKAQYQRVIEGLRKAGLPEGEKAD
jgi:adenylate cyclase